MCESLKTIDPNNVRKQSYWINVFLYICHQSIKSNKYISFIFYILVCIYVCIHVGRQMYRTLSVIISQGFWISNTAPALFWNKMNSKPATLKQNNLTVQSGEMRKNKIS